MVKKPVMNVPVLLCAHSLLSNSVLHSYVGCPLFNTWGNYRYKTRQNEAKKPFSHVGEPRNPILL